MHAKIVRAVVKLIEVCIKRTFAKHNQQQSSIIRKTAASLHKIDKSRANILDKLIGINDHHHPSHTGVDIDLVK